MLQSTVDNFEKDANEERRPSPSNMFVFRNWINPTKLTFSCEQSDARHLRISKIPATILASHLILKPFKAKLQLLVLWGHSSCSEDKVLILV